MKKKTAENRKHTLLMLITCRMPWTQLPVWASFTGLLFTNKQTNR